MGQRDTVTGTNAYIWAFDMAQVTNILIICLLRANLAVTKGFFYNVSFSFSFYCCSEKLMLTLHKE